jgi:hypothetical protein
MRSSSLPLLSTQSAPHSWLDQAMAICICILAVAVPVVISILVAPHYQLNQVADMFPSSSEHSW